MKQLYGLSGLLVLSQITGCASLMTPAGSTTEQIDYWLNRREYGKASALAADLKASPTPTLSNLQEIQDTINTRKAGYEQQVISDAELSAANNDWGPALALYQEALSRVPDSKPLQQAYQQLLRQQAETLEKLELDRLIAKSEWTFKDLEISRLAADEEDSWFGQPSLNEKTADVNKLAFELANHGKRALERQDLALAKRTLPLAMQLSSAIEIKALNNNLQEILKEKESLILKEQKRIADAQLAQQKMLSEQQEKKRRSALIQYEQKKTKRLLADFKNALHNKKLTEARQLIAKLEKQSVDGQELEKFDQQLEHLNHELAGQIKYLTEIGVTYYSQQQYDQAMTVWKKAQALDPNNKELTDHIERVTRVLEKLHDLRKKLG